MDFSNFDVDAARNASLIALGSSIFVALLVLKFVKSVVTKLLLIITCGLVGFLSFTQRDSLTACAEKVSAQIQAGDTSNFECTFFGRKVRVPTANTNL
jgi:chromate transport protein ChrA